MKTNRAHQCLWTRAGVEGAACRRVAVFASFDKLYRVNRDVRFWLQALADVCDAVVYISDHAIAEEDEEVLRRYTIHYECRRHGEYDFGSYKRGYLFLKEYGLLDKAEEVLFCNDSCYGPMKPLADIFSDFARHPGYGVYGLTRNNDGFHYPEHVQSFFLLFPARVFRADYFDAFMCGIRHEADKMEVIRKYEVGLSVLLRQHGEKFYTHDHVHALYNITWFHWRRFLKKCGLVKKNLMPEWACVDDVVKAVSARYAYPVEYISTPAASGPSAIILQDLPAGRYDCVHIVDLRKGQAPPQVSGDGGSPEGMLYFVSAYLGAEALDALLHNGAGVCVFAASTAGEFGQAIRTCLDSMGVAAGGYRLDGVACFHSTVDSLCGELAGRESPLPAKAPVQTCAFRSGMRAKWFKMRVKNILLWVEGLFC